MSSTDSRRPAAGGDGTLPARVPAAVLALVAAVAVLPYLGTLGAGFVDWDDHQNFLDNPGYRGFGPAQLRWMLTSVHLGHYMPVTWATHAVDHVLFGLDPAGYHLQNLLWFAAFTALLADVLYRVARRACAGDDRAPRARELVLAAAAGALLFALHPLRVESVAWVTERRDLVSGTLLLLAVRGYLDWVAAGARGTPRSALGWYALSLLAKTSGFVLPLALLVLDACPLGRLRDRRELRARLAEKAWWFTLAASGAILAVVGQVRAGGAVSTLDELGPAARVGLAVESYAFHLTRTLWPVGLAPLYPLRTGAAGAVGEAFPWVPLAALLAAAAGLFALRRRAPGLAAAGLAFAVIHAPLSGLVHVGEHRYADRYGFLASIPLGALAAVVLARSLHTRLSRVLALAVLAALGWSSHAQTRHWRDSVSLWSRVVAVTPASPIGHRQLGSALLEAGRTDEALASFERALELSPADDVADAGHDLAVAQASAGRPRAAWHSVLDVLAARPAHLGALALSEELLLAPGSEAAAWLGERAGEPRSPGRPLETALDLSRAALAEDPGLVRARVRTAELLRRAGQGRAALEQAERALALAPDDGRAHGILGLCLVDLGEAERARPHLVRALEQLPADTPGAATLRRALAGD